MFVSKQELDSAIGQFKASEQKRFYNGMCNIFTPLQIPKPGDWLHGSKEAHQSFANYRLPHYNPVTPDRRTIYIQEFDEFDRKFIDELCKFCRIFYASLDVKCLPPLQFQIQLGGIRKREGYYRYQYQAQDILAYMQKRVPNDAYCVMGITLQDIYPADSWLFAYGWAKYKARVGIFSFLRFDELYSRKKTDKINWEIILYPSMRTMAHQIGHMFGVTHCVYYRCLMNGFNGIQENYSKPFEFCPICFRKIFTNIRFDLIPRYKQLLDFCKVSNISLLKNDTETYQRLLQNSEKYPFKMPAIITQNQQAANQPKANNLQGIKRQALSLKTSFRLTTKKPKIEIQKPPLRPKVASTKISRKSQLPIKRQEKPSNFKGRVSILYSNLPK